ncbi:MAG: FAD-dependent oxidoreductase, partial [Planctomycetaceae bacterium]|nr:FAD-dependent oxidoreductase [Planctomycetaceae bacterium]
GGNTAIDVGRTAIRLGAIEVTVIVLESRAKMPAHEFEVKEALEEGVRIVDLRAIRKIEGNTLTLERMVDSADQWPQPSGQFETFEADVMVQALGQNVETGLLDGIPGVVVEGGIVQVDHCMMTGADGFFAGGDMVPSQRTVTTSIGHGKKAARSMDSWLRKEKCLPVEKHELASFDKLNTWYYSDAPRTIRPMLDVVRRQSGFAEVVGNLD